MREKTHAPCMVGVRAETSSAKVRSVTHTSSPLVLIAVASSKRILHIVGGKPGQCHRRIEPQLLASWSFAVFHVFHRFCTIILAVGPDSVQGSLHPAQPWDGRRTPSKVQDRDTACGGSLPRNIGTGSSSGATRAKSPAATLSHGETFAGRSGGI